MQMKMEYFLSSMPPVRIDKIHMFNSKFLLIKSTNPL
jgi:hypothetical protein